MKINDLFRVVVIILLIYLGILATNQAFAADPVAADSFATVRNWVIQGELLRDQGDLTAAQQKFDQALEQAGHFSKQTLDYAAVELASGYNLLLSNQMDLADIRLKSAYQKTGGTGYLHGLADLYLAYLYLSNADNQQALFYINNGLSALKPGANEDLSLSFELLRLGLNNETLQEQADMLLLITRRVNQLPGNTIKAKLSLKAAQKYLDIADTHLPDLTNQALQQLNYSLLSDLLKSNEGIGQDKIKADATGKLAQLYRIQIRNEEALLLTEQAINLANTHKDHVLSAQLQAQQGDLYQLLGDKERALISYDLAVTDLFAVRADMPINLPDGRSVLSTIIEPIYRKYVDLLLKSSNNQTPALSQPIIDKAINSMEAIKEADMQDFFLGRCSVSSVNNLDWQYQTFPETMIVYPILLPDRIELIIKYEHKLIKHIVKAPLQEVQNQTLALVEALHLGKDYRAASRQLYEWLILPIETDLQQSNTKVIVFVPDRFLRAMPLSALSDGKTFVVERYGIVTLPSLSLQNLVRSRLENQSARTLLAGLSKPDGAAIDQLPSNLIEKLSGQQIDREALIEELSLPSVEQEINSVAEKDKSTTLLNNQFTVSALKSDIETGQYNKVHIASHGYFGKNAKDSFIMAYDKNFTLLDFKTSLEADNLKQDPIELLTLSACKTAEGDDRMLLGFSGLAVKSNVLSAVGSLWSINDDATMEFMKLFYDGLNHSQNKAQAMREAQMSMIKNKKFKHPFFWSPFILIGNWQ